MLALTTDSPLGVVAIVVLMLAGATIGITVLALVASEGLRLTFSFFGDRDSELAEGSGDSDG